MPAAPQDKRYRQPIVEQAAIGMAALAVDGQWLSVNNYLADLLGYTKPELLALSLQAIAHPDDSFSVNLVLQSSNPNIVELRALSKNGKIIWCKLIISLTLATPTCLAYLIVIIEDISQQKLYSDNLHRSIFENAQWGIVIGSADCTTLELMNSAFAKMHGYTVAELTGQPISSVYAPECRADLLGHLLESHRSGHHVFESQHIRKNGEIFPVLIDITAVYDQHQQVQYRIVNTQDITERKNSENALRASEANLRQVQRIAHIGSWEWDMVSGEHTWSQENYQILGFDSAKVRPSLELFINLLTQEDWNKLAKCITTKRPYRLTLPITRPDGETRYIQTEAKIFFNQADEAVRMVGTNLDVTAYKEVEALLRKSEATQKQLADIQKSIFDALPASVLVIDSQANIVSSNLHSQMFGCGNCPNGMQQWQIGSNYFIACSTTSGTNFADTEAVTDGIRQILDLHSKQFTYKYCCNSLDKQRWFQMIAEPYPTDSIGGAIIMHFDVTESHLIQVKLDAKEREFRALAELSPDIIARFDANFRYLYVNPAIEKITKLPADSFLNKTNAQTKLPKSFTNRYESALRNVFNTGQEYAVELLLKWQSRHYVLHTHLVPEFDTANQITHVLSVTRDITELKTAENQLRESRTLLRNLAVRSEQAREQERKRIAGEIHDELGQLLTALRMEVSLISMEFGDSHIKLREKTDDIKKLIDSIISVVRHIATSLRPAILDAGINSALDWLAADFRFRYNIACSLDIEENIQIDEDQAIVMFRICQESLTNIARHASASQVKILLTKHHSCYELTIQDNGRGFDTHSPMSHDKYGLIGIQERAIMLGGKVAIDSVPGKGTVVFLKTPIQINDKSDD